MKKSLLSLIVVGVALMAVNAQSDIDTLFYEGFDGGIPETWTITAGNPEGAVWQWSADGQANSAELDGAPVDALFWGSRGPIQSPTVDNGVAMYNSDVYDGGGTGVGQGPFPGTHSGSLVSPPFDCSSADTLYVAFHQYARANANAVSTLIEVSVDTGNTWTSIPINPEVVGNGGTAPNDLELVDISEVAGGEEHVQLRFTWNGRYYYWLIDDIRVITPMAQELEMGYFFYPPSSFSTPVSQVAIDTFGFEVEVTNFGKDVVTNLVVNTSILERVTDTETELVWEDSLVVEEFPPFHVDTLIMPYTYVPDLPLGEYVVRYEVYSQDGEDFNPLNNARQDNFRVSARLFAKEPSLQSGTRPGTQADYQMGNYYRMSPIATEQFVTDEIFFGGTKNAADGPMGGETTTLFLYRVSDDVPDDFSGFDTSIETDDLEQIGFGFHTFTDDEEGELVSVPLTDLDGNPLVLEPGGRYFAVSEWADNSTDVFSGTNGNFEYFQIATVVRTSEWFLGGFGPETTSVVRMSIQLASTTDEEELPAESMTIFPNPVPVTDELNVRFNLDGNSEAMLVVADLEGRVLQVYEYENGLTNETVQVPTRQLAAGTYLVRLSTHQGTKTMKFNVIR